MPLPSPLTSRFIPQVKLQDFAPEFLKHRRKYHERAAKAEKIAALPTR
jgi:hypothetical protein